MFSTSLTRSTPRSILPHSRRNRRLSTRLSRIAEKIATELVAAIANVSAYESDCFVGTHCGLLPRSMLEGFEFRDRICVFGGGVSKR